MWAPRQQWISATFRSAIRCIDKGDPLATQTRPYGSARNKGPVHRVVSPAGKRNGAKVGAGSNGSHSTNSHAVAPSSVAHSSRGANGRTTPAPTSNGKPESKILFQKFFHSVGPRTYASQVKELANGNHLLVLTEGKRDEETGEVRKTRVFVYGEDFSAFFRLLNDTATFIRANPVPQEVRDRRAKFWARKTKESRSTRPSSE
jgi:hypothetical protein